MTITLSDGRTEDVSAINFDTSNYHFYLNSEDITALISRADKNANWPNFDPAVDNTRLYNEAKGGTGPVADLPTSTVGIFTDQLLTDPLAAPLSALDSGVREALQSTGVRIILAVGVVALIAIIVIKKK